MKFFFSASANESESDMAVEMSSTSAETITEEQEVRKDKDNEAEIGQYLTLAQLGNILRELSALGKTLAFMESPYPWSHNYPHWLDNN